LKTSISGWFVTYSHTNAVYWDGGRLQWRFGGIFHFCIQLYDYYVCFGAVNI